MKIVVDASVMLKWLFNGPVSEEHDFVLVTADEQYLRKALPVGQIRWLGDWVGP